jgi:hypothetical protein
MSATWREIERPVGPQPLPAWLKGVHIDWNDKYSNSPDVTLKATESVSGWPDQRWSTQGGYYRAHHVDGRMRQHYHDGALRPTMIRMFKAEDGSLHQYRDLRQPGEWIEVEMVATSEQRGYGGAHYHLTMLDGSKVVLRGPWSVGAPAGFVGVAYVNIAETRYLRSPWQRSMAIGGLFISHGLYIRALSRFQPHLRLARITRDDRVFIEPMKPEWDEPKVITTWKPRPVRSAA